MEIHYVAVINNEFVNYLYLLGKTPMRLKNTTIVRDTIFYTEKETEILKKLHENIEIRPSYEAAEILTNTKRIIRQTINSTT